MAITQRAEIDAVGYNVSDDVALQGHMEIRFAKLTFEGEKLLGREYVRTAVTPGTDIDAMISVVNAHMVEIGFGSLPVSDTALLKAQTAVIWTPEVVAAWKTRQEAVAAEDAARLAEVEAAARKKLEPWRFWTVVDEAFPEDGLRAAIKTAFANAPGKRAAALAKLNNPPGGAFDRDDDLFADADLMAELGLTAEEIDALWDVAWEL